VGTDIPPKTLYNIFIFKDRILNKKTVNNMWDNEKTLKLKDKKIHR
jgi:hypothetical protein